MGFARTRGGVCAPAGFRAAAVACGLKRSGEPDLCLIAAEERCAAAGTFTRNAFKAAPVLVTMEHLRDGYLWAVVVNAGNANACTGERGLRDAEAMASIAARELGIIPEEVAVASTGVIGRFLEMDRVEEGIVRAARRLDAGSGGEAARAIMTTDTRPKEVALDCGSFKVGGMAKGAGMIRPDMATMLAFLTTDARVDHETLARALRGAVEGTFNRITIDGCTSTNDMVLCMAGGASGYRPDEEELGACLREACSELARDIVLDGEGATRFVTVRVRGAAGEEEARTAAMAVAESPLVKTAVFGGDPNWGRVVQAVGAALQHIDPRAVSVDICGIRVVERGTPADTSEDLEAAVSGREVTLEVSLGRGEVEVEVWTCDLSYEYVRINAEYHT
ncbi:MAG: bifunctional glutamate N-acetyltransferase/amino-acid acetyltransferase ArgJ [Actinomycetota bacterium]|nr:bifunctional glutamate N-acetyltransferase/amino-acid acetyltransferase ArgJ [Actinomycetota bacterium]